VLVKDENEVWSYNVIVTCKRLQLLCSTHAVYVDVISKCADLINIHGILIGNPCY
jgi:hypothetical protein